MSYRSVAVEWDEDGTAIEFEHRNEDGEVIGRAYHETPKAAEKRQRRFLDEREMW